MRICKFCSLEKDIEDFDTYKKHGVVKHSYCCKKCRYARQNECKKRHPKNTMLQWARHRAKRDSVPFNLTANDFEIPTHCPILGLELKPGNNYDKSASPSLDRIRPELGYVKGNVYVISHKANRIKNNATLEEIEALLRYMEKYKS